MTTVTETTTAPVLDAIAQRRSVRNFDPVRDVTDAQLGSILESGRWAFSWGGSLPSRFAVARRGTDLHARLSALLTDGNAYASYASVLGVGAHLTAPESGAPFTHAQFDLGAAVAQMAVQASSLGLSLHPMAGFDHGRATAELFADEGAVASVAFAIGHPIKRAIANDPRPAELVEKAAARDAAPRTRRPLSDLVIAADGIAFD